MQVDEGFWAGRLEANRNVTIPHCWRQCEETGRIDNFAIAAGHDLTTAACEDILRAGGSAVDAAIAGALVACVAEPVLAGPLGGGFLMVRPAPAPAAVRDCCLLRPQRNRTHWSPATRSTSAASAAAPSSPVLPPRQPTRDRWQAW